MSNSRFKSAPGKTEMNPSLHDIPAQKMGYNVDPEPIVAPSIDLESYERARSAYPDYSLNEPNGTDGDFI